MAQNKALRNLLEVVVGSTEVRSSKQVKSGRLRKIATRVYTTNMDDSPEDIIRRNVFYILGQLYPHAVISHRSAFELKPTNEGDIFLTYKYTKKITLPGITVHLLQGPMGTDHDMPFIENLYISSTERRMLENLQKGRTRGRISKCLPKTYIEENLEKMLVVNGEAGINEFRDRAKEIAKQLNMTEEFETLNSIIGALLSTKPSGILTADSAFARAQGVPFDQERIKLFETLFETLNKEYFPVINEQNISTTAFRNFAFFESYFSNYIEGTEFEIEDAYRIITVPLKWTDRSLN